MIKGRAGIREESKNRVTLNKERKKKRETPLKCCLSFPFSFDGLDFLTLCPDNRDIQTVCLITKAGRVYISLFHFLNVCVSVCLCVFLLLYPRQSSRL